MTAPSPLEPPAPSWFGPIFLGALVALLSYLLLGGLQVVFPPACTVFPCCCAINAVPIGAFPAWLAFRRDPRLSPGQGFTVAFLATGIAGVLFAAQAALLLRDWDSEEARQRAREQLEEMNQDMPPKQRLDPEQLEEAIDAMIGLVPYLPVVFAALMAVVAGFVGLVTVSTLATRRSRQLQMQETPPQ